MLDPGVAAGAAGAAAGAVGALLGRKSKNRKTDAESAEVLAHAYTILVDDLRKSQARQDKELKDLREDLRRVVTQKDQEISVLRQELATERQESSRLRQRVNELELHVRTLKNGKEAA